MATPTKPTNSPWRTADADSIETVRAITADRSIADYRLENARLRLQVAVLERELDRADRTQQAVIDHYEALLSEREAELNDAYARLDDESSRLGRFLELWG